MWLYRQRNDFLTCCTFKRHVLFYFIDLWLKARRFKNWCVFVYILWTTNNINWCVFVYILWTTNNISFLGVVHFPICIMSAFGLLLSPIYHGRGKLTAFSRVLHRVVHYSIRKNIAGMYGAPFLSKLFRFPNTIKHFPTFTKLLSNVWFDNYKISFHIFALDKTRSSLRS